MDFNDYIAIYLVVLKDSQSRQLKVVQKLKNIDTLEDFIATDLYCQKYTTTTLKQLSNLLNINHIQIILYEYYIKKQYTEIYVSILLLLSYYLQQLEQKQLLVDEFLIINIFKDNKRILLIEIILKVIICIPSTSFRRILFSKFQQIIFLYSSYYSIFAFDLIDSKVIQTMTLDFVDGIRNLKDTNDVVEQANLFIVFLSNSPIELANKFLVDVENYLYKNYKDKNIFSFFNKCLVKCSTELQLFLKETIMYLSLLIFNRKLTTSISTYQIDEKFFTQFDDVNLINRHFNNLVFIPHSLLYHYSYKTYIFSQVQHSQIDLITSICIDILKIQQSHKINLTKNCFSTSILQQQDQYLAFYQLKDQIFIFFRIVQCVYTNQGFTISSPLNDGSYLIFQVHGSIYNHIQTLQLLKEILIAEIYQNSVTDLVKSQTHLPSLCVLQLQRNDTFRTANKTLIFLSFTLKDATNLEKVQKVLYNSIFQFSPSLDLEKYRIFANNFNFIFNEQLNKMIQPMKPAQMACLIHILCSDLLYIIGAPGTGKTFTAAQIIRAFLLQFNSHWYVPKDWKINQKFVFMKQQFPRISYHTEHIGFLHAQTPHHQIILTAHSNNATDQMAEALLKENFPLIKPFIYRLGSQSQSQIINQFTMEGYIQLFYQDLYRSNLIQQLRNPKLQDLKTVMEKNYHLFSNIICHFKSHHTLQQALLQKADIIVGTITGIQQQSPYLGKQSILIIEEAARVAEYNIASLVPLVPAKIIQIGDVLQLPPVIKDEKLSTNCGLQESLFHKQVQHEAPSILLNCQMRTTSQICDLYRDIYAVKLPLKLQQSLEDGIPNLQNSVFGYQVKGKYDNETNIEEVLKIKEIYDKLLQSYKPSQISVLSLYKKQIQLLNSHLQIKSFTVDEFQGLENDIIILSLANSFPSKFAQDLNRTLVAFSRGRLQLHVVGNISVYDNLIYQRFREIAEISK